MQVKPSTGAPWYRQAVIYAVDVGSFRDADADGQGDLRGVAEAIPYLKRLGVNCLWLLPFTATENRDNGYDVTDYFAVDPRFGTFGDFLDLLSVAEMNGIRIVVDLVVNHTSDQHPWFRAARERGPDNRYRDYYIWNDAPPPLGEQPRPIFPDRVPSVWTWNERAGSFYYHQFYPFQPALNHFNPAVREEVRRIISFWLRLGVSGFRVDAAPHLIRPPLPDGPDDPVDILREYRRHLLGASGDAILIGEADLEPSELEPLMGDDALQLLFNFVLNGHVFLALARGSAKPIVDAVSGLPHPDDAEWANFLRNLDEIDLERLTDAERDEVFAAFAPEPGMRIFGRGIRRRLAPILGNDPRRLRLAFALLLALPGPPVIVYGDEIGMGDDQRLPEREAVRTAMQWTPDRNGGFSSAGPEDLGAEVIDEGPFGFERVNVRDQERDPGSLLSFVRAAIRVRGENPELISGARELRALGGERVLCRIASSPQGGCVVALHNLSDERALIAAPELPGPGGLRVLLRNEDDPDPGAGADEVELPPFGFLWLRREEHEGPQP